MREIAGEKMRTNVLITIIVLSSCIQYGLSNTLDLELVVIDTALVSKQIWDRIDNAHIMIRAFAEALDNVPISRKEINDEIYRRVFLDISKISLKMDNLKQNFDVGNSLGDKVRGSPEKERIIVAERKLREQVNVVQEEFHELVIRLPKSFEDISGPRLCEYGNSRLNNDSLHIKIHKIFEEVYDEERFSGTFMALLREDLSKDHSKACEFEHNITFSRYLHALYNSIILTEVQGFTALSFSHYFVHDYNGTDGCSYPSATSAHDAVRMIYEEFALIVESITDIFIKTMENVQPHFGTCASSNDLENEWGDSIPRADLPHRSMACTNNNDCFSVQGGCRGLLRHCSRESGLSFCMNDRYRVKGFKWIKRFSPSNKAEEKSTCPNEFFSIDVGSMKDKRDSYLCMCWDNEPTSKSIHLVNLQSVEADVDKNMVLTGMKFIVKHRVLQLQIQQGELLDNWQIKNATWKPIIDISGRISASRKSRLFRGEAPNVIKNVDFLILDKSFEVDSTDVRVPDGHVLTGVKFEVSSEMLKFGVTGISRPFDYKSGKLLVKQNDAPTVLSSWSYGSIELTTNILAVGDDRIVEPLFDAQPLVFSPPTPLGGFAVVERTFQRLQKTMLTLKAISVDYLQYMRKSLDDSKKKISEESRALPVAKLH